MGIESEQGCEPAAELADDRIVQQARELLAELGDDRIVAQIEHAVETGRAEWRLDPFMVGVVHLVEAGTDRVSVFVYLNDRDLEVDEERLEEAGGGLPHR
jgi:hypothetical protein